MPVNAAQVQSTNDASIASKCSTAAKKYVEDDYVRHFVAREKTRASLIHLGYYARATLISEVLVRLVRFVRSRRVEKFQIISCGAGFDTTYWRLEERGLLREPDGTYVEMDYPDVVERKVSLIQGSEKLSSILRESRDGSRMSDNYFVVGVDLSDVESVEDRVTRIGVDFRLPTIFLSECVVTYMNEEDSSALLRWMRRRFPASALLNYEQIHPEDGFGRVMMRHFDKLDTRLRSVASYPDCESHRRRYRSLGFESSVVMSEWDFLCRVTTPEERERALCREEFDEFEEFHLKCVHYVFAVAANGFLSSWTESESPPPPSSPPPPRAERKCVCIRETEVKLEIFGHATCSVDGGRRVFIFGGFTPRGGRSKKALALDAGGGGGGVADVELEGSCGDRLEGVHGCAVAFDRDGRTYVGVFGGRTRPSRECNDGGVVLVELRDGKLRYETVVSGGPRPRYRATLARRPSSDGDGVSLWVFGGRTRDLKEDLSDLWELRATGGGGAFEWRCKEKRGAWPGSRMSHGAAACPARDSMYIACGLDGKSLSALNDVWKWSFATETWTEVKVADGYLLPRYGHTCHVRGNKLYMIGGANAVAGQQPGVGVLDLESLRATEYEMEPFPKEPVLLLNHSSEVVENEDAIRIFGGGGNCFSFGTHFNAKVFAIDLKQFE